MRWSVPKRENLVAFLQKKIDPISGKALRRLLEKNICRVNGRVERFGSTMLDAGDQVELTTHWQKSVPSPSSKPEILYENSSFLIMNKPIGWVCEPPSLAKTLGSHLFLVHRLDKETTGALIVAKTKQTKEIFLDLFASRKINKTYHALVDRVPKESEGKIETFLQKKRMFDGQTIWGSAKKGLVAITYWKKLFSASNASLIECEPITGRTHQIRVHLAEMGHPILIDRQYARAFSSSLFSPRVMLHARRLQFSFQEEPIDCIAPLFPDMRALLNEAGIVYENIDC